MIEVYKFLSNKYDSATTGWLTDRHMQINYDMRVHRHTLHQSQIRYDTRKYSFSNRIIPLWTVAWLQLHTVCMCVPNFSKKGHQNK